MVNCCPQLHTACAASVVHPDTNTYQITDAFGELQISLFYLKLILKAPYH